MKHFRPIKTFSTWLLEKVTVPMTGDEASRAREFIGREFRLRLCDQGDLGADVYINSFLGFDISSRPTYFYFPCAEIADRFHAKFGGERSTCLKKDSPRKNEAIFGNFTLDDLVYLYGDPLPNLIQYHLVDMEARLRGYFDRFKYSHQEWAHNTHWLPSAFVYVDRRVDQPQEILRWLYQNLQPADAPKNTWQQGWVSSASGVYEFDDPKVAALFKLTFGSGDFPQRISYRDERVYQKLRGPVSGISPPEGNYGTWERQANIPDYQNPRVVS